MRAEAASPEVALGHVVRRARRRARPLLRPLHAVLVRPAGDRLGGRVPFAPPPRVDSRADGESLRLRLRRADDRRARAARRQGDRARGDDADGRSRARRASRSRPTPAARTCRSASCPTACADEVDEHVRRLEERTGKRFGSDDDPLLVSVRSGAAVSMPGMMDTILNLGLNDEATEGLAARTDNPRFAYDSYRRLIQMFGEVVDGIDGHRFESALAVAQASAAAPQQDTDLGPDDLRELVATYKGIYREETGTDFPTGRARPAAARRARRLRVVGQPARAGVPPRARDRRRPRHRGQRRADGLRQQGRPLRHRRRVHARPVDRRDRAVRRVPRERPGRGRRRRHPHAAADRDDARARCRRRSSSCSTRCAGSRSTTATCRTSSSPSRTSSSTSCRRARRSAPRRRR